MSHTGFIRQIYRSGLMVTLMLSLIVLAAAQSEAAGQVLRVAYQDGNVLAVYVQVRDVAIDSASVLVDGDEQTLTITGGDTPSDTWLLLDSGASMLNVYPAVRDELSQLAQSFSAEDRIGLIDYNSTTRQLDPTDDTALIDDWLLRYSANPSADSCLIDALAQLDSTVQNSERPASVIIIAGESPSECGASLPALTVPLNIVVIGQTIDPFYGELIEQFGGQLTLTALPRLASAVQEMPSSASSQVVLLTLPLDSAIESTQLTVNFSNGERLSQTIQLPDTFVPDIPPTVASTVVPQATDTVAVTIQPAATDVSAAGNAPISAATDTPVEDSSEPVVQSGGIPNGLIIIGGGLAAVIVVVVVVLRLLNPPSSDEDLTLTQPSPQALNQTLVDPDDETMPKLDQTQVFTMRDVASQLGPTHVANLVNEQADTIYEIHRPQSLLGRQLGSDILIGDDPQISREHVRFDTRDGDSVWLVRLTNNPILVNGMPIENTHQLGEGDLLQLSPRLQVIFMPVKEEA